jgi:hypothetical protein
MRPAIDLWLPRKPPPPPGGAVMAQYQSRIGELEAWKSHMTTKYKRLEDRRAMDLEGFNRDVTALRKALGLTERKLHQMRLVLRLDVRLNPHPPPPRTRTLHTQWMSQHGLHTRSADTMAQTSPCSC